MQPLSPHCVLSNPPPQGYTCRGRRSTGQGGACSACSARRERAGNRLTLSSHVPPPPQRASGTSKMRWNHLCRLSADVARHPVAWLRTDCMHVHTVPGAPQALLLTLCTSASTWPMALCARIRSRSLEATVSITGHQDTVSSLSPRGPAPATVMLPGVTARLLCGPQPGDPGLPRLPGSGSDAEVPASPDPCLDRDHTAACCRVPR